MAETTLPNTVVQTKRLNTFERYLSLWVAACMVAGVLLGKFWPAMFTSCPRVLFSTRRSRMMSPSNVTRGVTSTFTPTSL